MGRVAYGTSVSLCQPEFTVTYSLLSKTNASLCLALTEKCVDILIIVENEILEAGADVSADLKAPLAALTSYVASLIAS